MVTKTYKPSYLCDSSDGRDGSDSGDSSDSRDSSEEKNIKNLFAKTKFSPNNFLNQPTFFFYKKKLFSPIKI